MKFNITHARQSFGNDVAVQASCEAAHSITRVTTTYDSTPIGDDPLDGHTTQYSRTFLSLSAGPKVQHKVVVTALDE